MKNLNGKVIGALLAGALIGTALGVLFAPEKGSKTRKKIADGAKDLTDDLSKKMKKEMKALRNKAEEIGDQVENNAKSIVNSVKAKAEELKNQS
jgi:gas vesicle protein